MVKIYKQLRESRKQRRLAKDSIRELTPLVTWGEDNKKEIEALKRTLGDVRKVEKMEDGRIYLYRTEIVAETLKKNDKA